MRKRGTSRTIGIACGLLFALVGGPTESRAQGHTVADLAWLEGRWVGSGGGYEAFYESFSVDGGVLLQRVHPDSTFTTTESVSEWRLEGDRIVKFTDGEAVSEISAIVGDSIRIERLNSDGPGYSWVRHGPEEWHAILERASGPPVRYVLRRY